MDAIILYIVFGQDERKGWHNLLKGGKGKGCKIFNFQLF